MSLFAGNNLWMFQPQEIYLKYTSRVYQTAGILQTPFEKVCECNKYVLSFVSNCYTNIDHAPWRHMVTSWGNGLRMAFQSFIRVVLHFDIHIYIFFDINIPDKGHFYTGVKAYGPI